MTTTILKAQGRVNAGRFLEALSGRLPELFSTWQFRITSRRRLARLDDRMLIDIGLDRVDVVRETGKPFWRA